MTPPNPPSSHHKVLAALGSGDLSLDGEFLQGYNYTFLAQVHHQDETYRAVYKPLKGEQPLWDFPDNTLAHRETAAYIVSEALGWQLVPPTVFRQEGPHGPGSLQLFISHNPEYHYFNLKSEDFQRLRPVVLFDLLINNADRKGSHLLFDSNDHLWLIDHGLCFNRYGKLRTVIWDFAEQPIPQELRDDVTEFREKLEPPSKLIPALEDHLSPQEISALAARASHLAEIDCFPSPPQDRRAYPYPPL